MRLPASVLGRRSVMVALVATAIGTFATLWSALPLLVAVLALSFLTVARLWRRQGIVVLGAAALVLFLVGHMALSSILASVGPRLPLFSAQLVLAWLLLGLQFVLPAYRGPFQPAPRHLPWWPATTVAVFVTAVTLLPAWHALRRGKEYFLATFITGNVDDMPHYSMIADHVRSGLLSVTTLRGVEPLLTNGNYTFSWHSTIASMVASFVGAGNPGTMGVLVGYAVAKVMGTALVMFWMVYLVCLIAAKSTRTQHWELGPIAVLVTLGTALPVVLGFHAHGHFSMIPTLLVVPVLLFIVVTRRFSAAAELAVMVFVGASLGSAWTLIVPGIILGVGLYALGRYGRRGWHIGLRSLLLYPYCYILGAFVVLGQILGIGRGQVGQSGNMILYVGGVTAIAPYVASATGAAFLAAVIYFNRLKMALAGITAAVVGLGAGIGGMGLVIGLYQTSIVNELRYYHVKLMWVALLALMILVCAWLTSVAVKARITGVTQKLLAVTLFAGLITYYTIPSATLGYLGGRRDASPHLAAQVLRHHKTFHASPITFFWAPGNTGTRDTLTLITKMNEAEDECALRGRKASVLSSNLPSYLAKMSQLCEGRKMTIFAPEADIKELTPGDIRPQVKLIPLQGK